MVALSRSLFLLLVVALVALAAGVFHPPQAVSASDTLPKPVLWPVIPLEDGFTLSWVHPIPGRELEAWFWWEKTAPQDGVSQRGAVASITLPADGSKTSHTFRAHTHNGILHEFKAGENL